MGVLSGFLGVLFRIREYLQGSLWSFPLIGAILGPLAANPRSYPVPLARRAPAAASVKTIPGGAAFGQSWFQRLTRPLIWHLGGDAAGAPGGAPGLDPLTDRRCRSFT